MEHSIKHTPSKSNFPVQHKHGISVLHVEDDDFDAALVQRNLRRCDHAKFNIVREKTIAAALQLLNKHKFDVILLDLHLPDGQGLDSVKSFSQDAKKTPVIVLTGSDHSNKAAELVELGVQDLLPKTTIDGNILHHSIRYAIYRKEKENNLRAIKQHDELTGLLNQMLIHDRISHAISRHQRNRTRLAVLYINIDDFKDINNSLGPAAGDATLRHVAKGLKQSVRREDSVARVGADEFVVLLENLSDFVDLRVIITKLIDVAFSTMSIGCEVVHIQGSIGVSTYDTPSGESVHPHALLEQAEFSMYRAKQRQGSQYEIFDQTLHTQHDMQEALSHLATHNFDRSQFRVAYAPILTADRNGGGGARDLFGAQAQLTWVRHSHEHRLTADLLTLVENMSVAKKLGVWLLREAMNEWKTYVCCTKASSPQAPVPKLFLSLPPKFLYDNTVISDIARSVKELSFDPECLVLEMFGRDVLGHMSLAQAISTSCRNQLGVSICLSDFGSHHCSVALLQEIACDYLRLSPIFFSRAAEPKTSLIIATEIHSMACKLGLNVLAPDNCTAHQRQLLEESGITLFQRPA
jgi:diguanylate cyclase (GGDEF)-like protein